MDRAILMGGLTRDSEVRYSQEERSMAITGYTLTMNRGDHRDQDSSAEQQTADFTNCVAFDRAAELAKKYFCQGMQVLVSGKIQTDSYINKEGQKVYTTEITLDDRELVDSKDVASEMEGHTRTAPSQRPASISAIDDRFMDIPGGVEGEGLPFN